RIHPGRCFLLGYQPQHGYDGGGRDVFQSRVGRAFTVPCTAERYLVHFWAALCGAGPGSGKNETGPGRARCANQCRRKFRTRFSWRSAIPVSEFIPVSRGVERTVHRGDFIRGKDVWFFVTLARWILDQCHGSEISELPELGSGG